MTPTPANPLAQVTEIKSGRRNSAKDADKLNQIIRLAQEVLGEIDDTEDNGNANEEPKANPEGEEQTEAIRARKDALLETIKSLENEEVTK